MNDPAPPEEQEETAPLQQEDSLSVSSPDDTDSFAPSHLEVPTLEEVSDMEEEGDDKNDDCPQPPQNQSSNFVPGDHLRMGVELMDLCNQCQVPLHMYDKFLRLFKNYSKLHTEDSWWKSIPTRENLLKELKSKYPSVQPEVCKLSCPEDIVMKFPFLDMLLDLFSAPYFQDIELCCVNLDENSPFGMYKPAAQEGLSELLCAQWYKDTYQKQIGDHPQYFDPVSKKWYHNWLIPLKFYNNKTGVSAIEGSYTLEPLMFTVGILRRKVLESNQAWRHAGFIPSRSVKSKNPEQVGQIGEQSLAFTHECLSILLDDLVALQGTPPLLILKLFGRVYRVQLILEVACVIGDQLSQDTHCCRKKINGGGAGRIHRSCLTSFTTASNPRKAAGCTRISKKVIDNLCESIWLHEDEDK